MYSLYNWNRTIILRINNNDNGNSIFLSSNIESVLVYGIPFKGKEWREGKIVYQMQDTYSYLKVPHM